MNLKNFNPSTVTIGNTIWMAENLSIDDGEGEVFIKDNEYYYTWNSAKRIADKLGWKLPSDEDWDKASEECGGIKEETDEPWGYVYNNCTLMKKLNASPINSYYRFTGKFNDKGRCFEPYDLKYYLNYCEPHSTFWSLSERKGEENISAYTRSLYITKSEQGVDYKRRNAFPVRLINTILNT